MEHVCQKRFNSKKYFEPVKFELIDLLGCSNELIRSFNFTYFILDIRTSNIMNSCKPVLDFFGITESYFYHSSLYELIIENTHADDINKFEKLFNFIHSPHKTNYSSILKIRNCSGIWRHIYMNVSMGQASCNQTPDHIYICCVGLTDLIEENQKLIRINREPKSSNKESLISLLSKREKEILKLVVNGFTDKEIALKLNISSHTAITHRKNIISKLRVKNTASLAFTAGKIGIF